MGMDFLSVFKTSIKYNKVTTDNIVFRLHYKLTVLMLIVFSALLTSKQYFGEPILCDAEEKKREVIEGFCWITGTFIIQETLEVERQLPGLGNYRETTLRDSQDEFIWQHYYQWVCIVFCFQALCFYFPRYIWKNWDGGQLQLLIKTLNEPLVAKEWTVELKQKMVDYILLGQFSHNVYAIKFAICEFMNLINVVVQIFFLNWFLMGQFSFYGLAVSTSTNVNQMTKVFPKITKCRYNNYGPSGSIQEIDALCVLTLNKLNQVLYLILWYWLVLLTVLSFIAVCYRMTFFFWHKLRFYLLIGQTRALQKNQFEVIVKKLSFGDLFMLYQIGKNINPIVYKDLISSVYDEISKRNSVKNKYGFNM